MLIFRPTTAGASINTDTVPSFLAAAEEIACEFLIWVGLTLSISL